MQQNIQPVVNATERRAFERVQDAVGLQILRLRDMPAAGDSEIQPDATTPVRRANKYDIDGYGEVRRAYPSVAAYVEELEERIRQLSMDGINTAETPTHKVSLSASGMAFADDFLYYPGEMVGVRLTLFPANLPICFDARIVSAGNAPEIANGEKHTYRLTFVRIDEDDKMIIRDHVRSLLRSLPNDAE